jgi:hypothetical protein
MQHTNDAKQRDCDSSLQGSKSKIATVAMPAIHSAMLCGYSTAVFHTEDACVAATHVACARMGEPYAAELEALLRMKAAIDPGEKLQGCPKGAKEFTYYCKWREVTCNDGYVTHIGGLWGKDLQGTLPPASAFDGLNHLAFRMP